MFEDRETYPNKILDWNVSGVDNIQRKFLRGGHVYGWAFDGNRILDPTNDSSQSDPIYGNSRGFTYSRSIDKAILTGHFSLFNDMCPEGDPNFFNNVDSLKNLYSMFEGDDNEDMLKAIWEHDFVKRYALQNLVSVTLIGHENRYAGDHVYIYWPSGHADELNKQMKGVYMTKSITHSFSNPSGTGTGGNIPYLNKIVLIKNAYDETDSTRLYKRQRI